MISKLRCSNHDLEIEKGRHREVLAEMRYCNICRNGTVENETYFLLNCEVYQPVRELINTADINSLINTESQAQLYDFLKKHVSTKNKVTERTRICMRRDVGVSGDRGGGVIFLHVKCCFVVSVFVFAMFTTLVTITGTKLGL